jgi:hypothetical protein
MQTRSEAAHKAWRTIRKNKKLFEGFIKPTEECKFGIHLVPIPACNGPNGEDKVMYYEKKEEMRKDIRKFQKDDQVSAIVVFQVVCMRDNGF